VPRYLLQQWTAKTITQEDEDNKSHGVELWATPSASPRLLDLEENDVVFVAGVVNGRLLPVSRLVVGRIATYDELIAEGHEPYELPFHALAKPPLPRMNLREHADDALSLALRKESGAPLARRRTAPTRLDGQAFRVPQWIDRASAQRLGDFLDGVWDAEDDSGLSDPARVSRGLAPRLSTAERHSIERRAMDVVEAEYRRHGYDVLDVSGEGPWDLTATHPDGQIVHIEVKGTTGTGHAVSVTAGERRHAEEFGRPALAIVTGIHLTRGRSPTATGGALAVHLNPWSTSDGHWITTVWRYEPTR
jgi:hypothetical protein